MAKNEQKTLSQQKRTLKGWKWTCFIGEFVSAFTPFVVIGLANYDKYFVEYDGSKMSIALFMALGLMGFVVWAITKKKLENNFITFLIGWVVVAFIFTMLGELITDISTIMWFGAIGIAGTCGLMEGEKALEKKIKVIDEVQQQANKEIQVEQAKEEIVKKVKVKVKK